MTEQPLLTDSSATAVIGVPLDQVDIADWLFTMSDAEYQRCAPGAHIAAGTTKTDDGRLMSINVEEVGESLIVEHYVAVETGPRHCLLVSLSDSLSNGVWTKVQVTWELTAQADEASQSVLVNRVEVRATDDLLALLEERHVDFDAAARLRHESAAAHNALETPLFAQSIARHASATRRDEGQYHEMKQTHALRRERES